MTVKQIQHLLAYLGYAPGDIDGLPGPRTTAAVREFQGDYGGLKVDGDAGKDTAKALQKAVGEGWQRPKANDPPQDTPQAEGNLPAWWKDIRYFTRQEFRCPCGKCGGFPVEPNEKLVRFMDAMREDFGKAVIVVPPDGHSGGSGVRCQTYNDSLKGSVTNSYHTTGKAADFSAPGVGASTIESYLTAAQAAGMIRYWYCISAGNYHVDVY